MSLLDRRRAIVRLCAHSLECWRPVRGGYERGEQRTLPQRSLQGLSEALADLEARLPPKLRADLVIESAWLPVMALPTGQNLVSRNQLEALLQHRLQDLYGADQGPWDTRIDHAPGEAQALGYAFPAALREVLLRPGASWTHRWSSIQPAFAWGRTAHRLPKGPHWWFWIEQDRALAAVVDRGQVQALDAAMTWPSSRHWDDVVATQRLKLGINSVLPTVIAGFERRLGSEVQGASQCLALEVPEAAASQPVGAVA